MAKEMDFSLMKATDLPFNKRITVPEPMDNETEINMQHLKSKLSHDQEQTYGFVILLPNDITAMSYCRNVNHWPLGIYDLCSRYTVSFLECSQMKYNSLDICECIHETYHGKIL